MADGTGQRDLLEPHQKMVRARVKGAGVPSDAQLAAVNALALGTLTAEDVCVRTFALAHNGIDRDNECFSSSVLSDFARTLPEKGVYFRHPGGWSGDGAPAVGRWIDATIERMTLDEARVLLREPALQFPPLASTAEILMATAYFMRGAGIDDVLRKMDGGIVGDVSIGFSGKGGTKPLLDATGHELTTREWQSPQDALEGSLVWIGAQQGARAIKQPKTPKQRTPEQVMATEKTPQEKTIDDLREKAAAAEGKATKFDAVQTALGETLASDPAQLKLLADAGGAYRKSLVESIITAEREAKRLGDDAGSVETATKDYERLTTPTLERMAKAAEASLPKGGAVAGGTPGAETTKGAPATGTETKGGGFAGLG